MAVALTLELTLELTPELALITGAESIRLQPRLPLAVNPSPFPGRTDAREIADKSYETVLRRRGGARPCSARR